MRDFLIIKFSHNFLTPNLLKRLKVRFEERDKNIPGFNTLVRFYFLELLVDLV